VADDQSSYVAVCLRKGWLDGMGTDGWGDLEGM